MDKHVNSILKRELARRTLLMFEDTVRKIIRYTDVQGSIPFTGKNINKVAQLGLLDGRVKPGHDKLAIRAKASAR